MAAEIAFTLNGEAVVAHAHPSSFLLRYLRDDAGLTGTKNGCSTGHCGACMVLIDGESQRSCLIKMKAVAGKQVETIESLDRPDGQLHPVQQAYMAAGATQCGFCTPGFVMSTRALLEKNPAPTDSDIAGALDQNICRCTGYVKIYDAVHLAARLLQAGENGAAAAAPAAGGLGVSVQDMDGAAKVRGRLPYGDDLTVPGMLHGKILLSAHPHAEILSIDTAAALAVPGVHAVLTHKDVPGHNGMGSLKADQPVLCSDRVRFVGDAVALVLAETAEAAEAGRKLVRVEYRPLEPVTTAQQGLDPAAPRLHPDSNICKHLVHEVGDVAAAFATADIVMEGHFETPFVEHAYLEPEAGVGLIEDDDVVVQAPTQFPFEVRRQLAAMLALPEERVRVVVTPVGGGFGSKCDTTIEGLLALGARVTRRPVKITLTRDESLKMSTKRHAYAMDYKVAATRDGLLTAVQARLVSDAGPYTDLSPRVIDQACIFACGPYRVPYLRIEGYAVYTNNVRGSAFRGFGINQVAFAVEGLIDEIARKLDMDPFEIRDRNALDVGDRTASGEILKASVATRAVIARAREGIAAVVERYRQQAQGTKRIGVGIAAGFKNVGAGKGKVDDAGAILELLPGGRVRLRVSAVDMGQGIRTALLQIAVEATGIAAHRFEVITGDTNLTPRHGGAVGERQTLISGNAAMRAAQTFRRTLLEYAGEIRREDPADLDIQDHIIVHLPSGRTVISLADLQAQADGYGDRLEGSHFYVAPRTYSLSDNEARRTVPPDEYRNYPAYAYAAQAAVVEVDEATGATRVLHVIAAHDVGRAINPRKIEGQLEGSVNMGQGYALSEEYPMKDGRPVARHYRHLGVPGIGETPVVETVLVEDPEPNGPYGAKGISEVATVPITPAIINAIRDAVGVRIYTLPATPERVLAAIRAQRVGSVPVPGPKRRPQG